MEEVSRRRPSHSPEPPVVDPLQLPSARIKAAPPEPRLGHTTVLCIELPPPPRVDRMAHLQLGICL